MKRTTYKKVKIESNEKGRGESKQRAGCKVFIHGTSTGTREIRVVKQTGTSVLHTHTNTKTGRFIIA